MNSYINILCHYIGLLLLRRLKFKCKGINIVRLLDVIILSFLYSIMIWNNSCMDWAYDFSWHTIFQWRWHFISPEPGIGAKENEEVPFWMSLMTFSGHSSGQTQTTGPFSTVTSCNVQPKISCAAVPRNLSLSSYFHTLGAFFSIAGFFHGYGRHTRSHSDLLEFYRLLTLPPLPW